MIGIPTNGDMKILTAVSLMFATNLLRTSGHEMAVSVRSGPYTHWNREHLIEDAINAECEHLMFVDTDVVFPTDGILRLLDRDKDIIGAPYNLKQTEPVSTIKLWNDDRTGFRAIENETFPEDPFQLAAVPTGFMLIRLAALKAMEPPYFPCEFGVRGEDVAFCLNAQEAGLEVWCDPTIAVTHIGDYAY